MVATDGRRLALVEKGYEFPVEQEREMILPSKTVAELQRALGTEGDVMIMVQKSQISFDLGGVKIFSKLVDDTYPNYMQVIPTSCEKTIDVDRQLLVIAVERVSVMSNELHSTKLRFADNLLVVSSAASDIGEAKDADQVRGRGDRDHVQSDVSA